jgi:DNA repair protein RadD
MAALRPYQQRAVDAAISWMLKDLRPALIEAATGAGKSHMIAAIAGDIHQRTRKRVLCLAPSAELVEQNRAKYLASGNPCSMFSASAGAKDLRYPVVFGSPLTVKNRISAFQRGGESGYALVVVDECHGITPTVRSIIDAMREANPNLRVLGLTATPYRLGSGYIFRQWPDGRANGDDTAREPYFAKCVESIGARELIDGGYLTPPVLGGTNAEGYDTSGLALNSRGQFDADAIDKAYHGHGRKTAGIVSDIVAQAQGRMGVLLFAATVQHAREVLASLPPQISAIVTGDTPKDERKRILRRFLALEIKYLVNVSVLTTGFDATHVDVVAILRKTESVGLLQQIVGRGLRLHDSKRDCLILDYTSNMQDHCPDGDLFAPVIKAGKMGGTGEGMEAKCPLCSTVNTFTVNPDYADYQHDDAGYILDLNGVQVLSDHGPISRHFGRRCFGESRYNAKGQTARCEYRWTHKECPHCEAPNDIAARYCIECRGEIVDPNEKLIADFKAVKRDPTQIQTDKVISMTCQAGVSRGGNKTMRVEFVTPYRQFAVWLMPEATHTKGMREWAAFCDATEDGNVQPMTVTYRKDAESGFYRVFGYNAKSDAARAAMWAKHAAE